MTDRPTEEVPRRGHEPVDRLGRIADRLFDHLRGDSEHHPDDRIVVLLSNRTTEEGLTGHSGYPDDDAVDDVGPVFDLFIHLRQVFLANGKDLVVAFDRDGVRTTWPPSSSDLDIVDPRPES